jgi:hypothetical protein
VPIPCYNIPMPTNLLRHGTVETKCIECYVQMKTAPSRLKNGRSKYCSSKCRALGLAKRYKGRKGMQRFGENNPNWRGRRSEKVCPICSTKFKSINATCSNKCGHVLHAMKIATTGNGNWISNTIYNKRNYRKLINTSKCSVCGNEKRVVAHHIDGNRSHNVALNLVALCHWCHTTLHFLADQKRRGCDVKKLDGLVNLLLKFT